MFLSLPLTAHKVGGDADFVKVFKDRAGGVVADFALALNLIGPRAVACKVRRKETSEGMPQDRAEPDARTRGKVRWV